MRFTFCLYDIENSAKAKALAEFRFGKAIGKQNVLLLHLGWGWDDFKQ